MSDISSPNSPAPPSDAKSVKDTSRRDILLATLVGVSLVGFLVYGFLTMSADVTGRGQTGKIIEKVFLEAPETQFTVGGAGGLRRQELPGRFVLRIQVGGETGPIYRIAVSQSVFDSVNVGDSYFFVPTPDAMLPTVPDRPDAGATVPDENGALREGAGENDARPVSEPETEDRRVP